MTRSEREVLEFILRTLAESKSLSTVQRRSDALLTVFGYLGGTIDELRRAEERKGDT